MTLARSNHQEVLDALREVALESGATAELGARIQADRGSELTHLGLRTPLRRRRVKQGFSFTTGGSKAVLAAWDDIWRTATVADVMFAPLDFYRARTVDDAAAFSATVAGWIERVDNWAHADDLARVYSRALEASADVPYPTLLDWSAGQDQWRQRIAMVSLIRYSGKNVNFMPVEQVLAIVANCVTDERETVRKAVGWVLRETMKVDEPAVRAFLDRHAATISAATLRRINGGS